jgi:UDP-N-acetylmuramate dehydrogenase
MQLLGYDMSVMNKIRSVENRNLSFYRTKHIFEHYGEFQSVEEFHEYCSWAKENNVKIYILGNGSNTLFTREKVKTLILKNNLNKNILSLSDTCFEVSSSVLVLDILKECYRKSLDSFYYLASVPATVGGALAMNAGRGREYQLSIYDFIESVTFFDFEKNCLVSLEKSKIVKGYRETIFTGSHSKLILSAIFQFQPACFNSNPIVERIKWTKEIQDNTAPNCGSVFKLVDYGIISRLKGLRIGGTSFSDKTHNWILNRSNSSRSILVLIYIVKMLHFLSGKKAKVELILVE